MLDNKNTQRDPSAGLNLEEEFLSIQQVRDKQPQSRSKQALEEPLPVALLEAHHPAEWEVETQQ